MTVYDSYGVAHTATFYFVSVAANTWDLYLYLDDLPMTAGGNRRQVLTFSGGALSSAGLIVYDPFVLTNGAYDLEITLVTTGLTQTGAAFAVTSSEQDGYGSGRVTATHVTPNGEIRLDYSNGISGVLLGQLLLGEISVPRGARAKRRRRDLAGNARFRPADARCAGRSGAWRRDCDGAVGLAVGATESTRMRILLLFFAGVTAVAILGITVTMWRVDDGIDRFRQDPLAHTVARDAWLMAHVHRDNIFQRLLTPFARVVSVSRRAGHCLEPVSRVTQTPLPAGSGPPALARIPGRPDEEALREYQAHVRFYTLFAIPAGDFYLECGGGSSVKPPGWN